MLSNICVLSGPYLYQNTVPQTYDGPILVADFPLNLTIFLSHPENCYIYLLFLFFRNELVNKLNKKMTQ